MQIKNGATFIICNRAHRFGLPQAVLTGK